MAAGSIVVDLLMRTGSFETDTKRAEKRLKEMEKTAIAAGKMLAGAFTAATTAAAVLVGKTINAADEIGRLAQLSNTSVESFQKMAFGAQAVGIQQDKLADIFKDTQDKVGDFLQTGGGALADFFENIAPKVGVTADQFRRLSGPDALQLYVSSLEKANLSQSDMIFYLEAIASDSSLLLPLLQDNGRAMQEFGSQAERTGSIMSGDLVNASKEFQQNLRLMKAQVDGLGVSLANQVLPFLNDLARELKTVSVNFNLVELAGNGFKVLMQTVLVLGANVAFVLQGIGRELGGLAAQAAALARGDIGGAREIGRLMREDAEAARKALDEFDRRIMGAGTARGAGGGRGSIVPPLAVPSATALSTAPQGGKPEKADNKDWLDMMQGFEDMRRAQIQINRSANEQMKKQDQDYSDWMLGEYKKWKEEEEAYQDWMRGMQMAEHDRYYDMLAQREDATKKTQDLAKELGLTFTSAFEDAIVEGKKLSDVLRGLAQDILRIATRKLITEPLGNMLTSAIGGMFGGAKAGGGDVIGGRSYLVGENGPEMFTPRTAGTITPSGATGGTTIVQNINVTTGVQQTVRAEIMSLMPQIAGAAKAAVADAKLRGGSYAAALR